MAEAVLPALRRRAPIARRILHGGGVWPAVPALVYLLVFLALPMVTLLAFGFLNTDWAVLIGMTQIHLPFMILPLLAVLAERDRRFEEASLNLGASRTETFFRVVVPMTTPAIFAGLALVFAVSYTNFIVPQLLG